MDILGKTFLISGGASGLGAGTAQFLTEKGANIAIVDINEETGELLALSLGDRACFIKTDVSDENAVQTAVSMTVETYGALHGAINCAGIAFGEKILSRRGPHRLSTFTKTIEVNLYGTFNVSRLAAQAIANNEPMNDSGERGLIISTTSVAAYEGQIGQVAYSASKGAIVGMTIPIARDLASHGIRMVTIAPGIFDTPLLAGMPENVRQSLAEQVPFPSRLGTPNDYAKLVGHIIENEMLNGEVIRLDGAIRMAPK
ncbi:SDR family NAD(P)-dependent oxidoreductase [Chloroflexi bacterium TSY]|nr:SDR family NAD(P)-dependent oxidoreductase [Chloroflexi bacterium TSY]